MQQGVSECAGLAQYALIPLTLTLLTVSVGTHPPPCPYLNTYSLVCSPPGARGGKPAFHSAMSTRPSLFRSNSCGAWLTGQYGSEHATSATGMQPCSCMLCWPVRRLL